MFKFLDRWWLVKIGDEAYAYRIKSVRHPSARGLFRRGISYKLVSGPFKRDESIREFNRFHGIDDSD